MSDTTTVPLDAETRVAERPHDHKAELRLWLRLFTCKTLIEGEVRRRLRETFDVTFPRFDLMAQLDRAPWCERSVGPPRSAARSARAGPWARGGGRSSLAR